MTSPRSQAAYVLALASLKGVGPWTAVAATRAFPDPEALLEASPNEREAALGRRFAGKLATLTRLEWPTLLAHGESQVDAHERRNYHVVAIDDEGYPPLIRLAPNPAVILYVRGRVDALATPDTVAVVGTRRPTAAGAEVARRLAQRLAEDGFAIVSGLAAGIDEAGHRGALDGSGRTIAVLGTAIDKVYPAANKPLAEEIVRSGGALVSEYGLGFPTSGRHFVERDRLQAGLSVAVIAVQTGVEGGTLHTIRFAHEARRAVLVPRPLAAEAEHPMYGGIHALVASRRAQVIETHADYPDLVRFLRQYGAWIRDGLVPAPTLGGSQDAVLPEPDVEQRSLGL